MFSWLRQFLSNLIVCVLQDGDKCRIHAQIVKNSKSIKSIELEFDVSGGKIDPKFNKQLRSLVNSVHSVYLSVLLSDAKQWALPVSSGDEFRKFGVNLSDSKVLQMPNSWSIVLPKDVLKGIEHFLNGTNPDLIYSPFALLYEKIRLTKQKPSGAVLYIYVQQTTCAMLIFDGEKMKFAAFFNSQNSQVKQNEYPLNTFDTHDLDTIITTEEDKINSLDSLGNLDDSDSNEFADIQSTPEPEAQSEESIEKSIQGIGKSMSLIGNMKIALDDFYKSGLYESDFVNSAVIYDCCGLIDEHFPDMVESEFMMESRIHAANAGEELISVIKRELGL